LPTAIVTGSGGLIGSETVSGLIQAGFEVVGIENDMRARFFGPEASTASNTARLLGAHSSFRSLELDIRDPEGVMKVFAQHGSSLELVVHAAAQPSHDWAASDPQTDFAVNANGTLNLLEAARKHQPDATFAFLSTNKVYGDRPNSLPLVEAPSRLELTPEHPYFEGIDASMSVDRCLHSIFGAAKLSADLMVQEYGRYFGMPTVCFRAGCVTGPQHAGVKLHGFLSYLMRCTVSEERYIVRGYGGKQVRDNLHAADVFQAIWLFHRQPRAAAVYNLGGGRENSVSVLEAIQLCQAMAGRELDHQLVPQARTGDHRWWISDMSAFRRDYPDFKISRRLEDMLGELFEVQRERWQRAA
jgi:CDP-paratose 2-epimerase